MMVDGDGGGGLWNWFRELGPVLASGGLDGGNGESLISHDGYWNLSLLGE